MGKLDHFAFLMGLVFFAGMAGFAGLDNNGEFVTISLLFFVALYIGLALFAPRKKNTA
ncbi:MAG: hypothetical protein COB94_005525 [Gammaproteobacteria bacterium]|nr:hypothetical protein [Gammaproteobacteria bacterium]